MVSTASPLLTAAVSSEGQASQASEPATAAPTVSDNTVTPKEPDISHFGRESAMFSTGLGARPQHKLLGHPNIPVIVRSGNIISDVAVAAEFWRHKYPYQYLSIFPGSGLKINDIWDEYDIHLETENFCKQVLRFIEGDNATRAQKYSQDYIHLHPERLSIIGGDMTKLYDKCDPISVVDKIFVNNERQTFPPVFLWHTAHHIRRAMLAVKGIKLPNKVLVSENNLNVQSGFYAPTTTGALVTMPTGTTDAPTDSKRDTSLTSEMIDMAAVSTPMLVPTNPATSQSTFPRHPNRPIPPTHGHTIEFVTNPVYPEHRGHRRLLSTHQPRVMNTAPLRVPKTRSGRPASGTYSSITLPSSFVENTPRMTSGHGFAQHTGSSSLMHSPRHAQLCMAVNHQMATVPPGIVPMAYEQAQMMPGMMPPSPSVIHPGMMPQAMQNSSMAHGFPRNTSNSQNMPYGTPMGDMTNMPFAMGPVSHNFDFRRPSNRRLSQQHTNANALYDPYEGSNPAFRSTGYPNGRKYNQVGSRPQKGSYPGDRPNYAQYTADRSGSFQGGPNYGGHFAGSKPPFEADPAKTEDREYGCNHDWIGPSNDTVDEVYVNNLPEDIQQDDLHTLFLDKLGVKPTMISILPKHGFPGRKHAFVAFSSTAFAKKAMEIRDATIRGSSVLIRVPNKFFRLATLPRDTTEAGPTSYSRYTSHPNNRGRISSIHDGKDIATPVIATGEDTSYSPQDARSDLPKAKKKNKHPQQGTATAGSPEARKGKSKKRPESPKRGDRAGIVEETLVKATQQTTMTDVAKTNPKLVSEAIATHEAPKEQSGVDEISPLNIPEEQPETSEIVPSGTNEPVPSVAAQEQKEPSTFVEVSVAAGNAPDLTSDQQQTTGAEDPSSQPPLDLEPHIEGSKKEDPSEKLKEVDEEKTKPTPTKLLEGENVASDDDMKNEASFRSAAETPIELVTKGDFMVDSGTAEHGFTSAMPEATKIASPIPVVEKEAAQTALSSQDSPPSVPQDKGPSETATKAEEMPSVDLTAAGAAHTAQENKPPTPVVSIATDPPRKPGAQKTESLHPFSKAAKAQAKKEKEQKKKAQKKEREQAEKARFAKAVTDKPTAKNAPAQIDECADTTGGISRSKFADDAKSKVEDEAIKPSVTSVSDAPIEEALPIGALASELGPLATTAQGKRKGKKQGSSIVTTGGSDTNHGKQIGGTVSSPNEPSLVTNKEANIEVPNASQEPDAQPPKQEKFVQATSAPGESVPAADTAEESSPSGKKKPRKKKKKAPPAWTNLKFRPKSPNSSWMGPIDTATDVQNYDEIMNKACGGEDDSDFSWSDLLKVENTLSPDDGDSNNAREHADGDQDSGKGRQQVASLKAHRTGPQTNKCAVNQELAELEASVQAIDNKIVVNKAEIAAYTTDIAAADAQLADSQPGLDAGASQPAKKRKPNKHNNKKKKKKPAEIADTADASDPTPTPRLGDSSIDPNDPFIVQMAEIEAIEQGKHVGSEEEAVQKCDESKLMRTMEAYFKETQDFDKAEDEMAQG
ncbi:hypothetical protein G6514_002709 [Epicoccum nigrum]|nr:hypothetical protein G6514_002709 [Epicoccum nigrum]